MSGVPPSLPRSTHHFHSTVFQDPTSLSESLWPPPSSLISTLASLNKKTRGPPLKYKLSLLKYKLSHVTPLSKTPPSPRENNSVLGVTSKAHQEEAPCDLTILPLTPSHIGMLPPKGLGTSGSLCPRTFFPEISPGLIPQLLKLMTSLLTPQWGLLWSLSLTLSQLLFSSQHPLASDLLWVLLIYWLSLTTKMQVLWEQRFLPILSTEFTPGL